MCAEDGGRIKGILVLGIASLFKKKNVEADITTC